MWRTLHRQFLHSCGEDEVFSLPLLCHRAGRGSRFSRTSTKQRKTLYREGRWKLVGQPLAVRLYGTIFESLKRRKVSTDYTMFLIKCFKSLLLISCFLGKEEVGAHSFRRGGTQYFHCGKRWDIKTLCDRGGWSQDYESSVIFRYLMGAPFRPRKSLLDPLAMKGTECFYCGNRPVMCSSCLKKLG